ncbi:hypothetical protein FB451DRAFT_1173021 [Mycena latifolia]|nr:hypothetical protein FB451DRAFT_1173021 [Mycena latifolia]
MAINKSHNFAATNTACLRSFTTPLVPRSLPALSSLPPCWQWARHGGPSPGHLRMTTLLGSPDADGGRLAVAQHIRRQFLDVLRGLSCSHTSFYKHLPKVYCVLPRLGFSSRAPSTSCHYTRTSRKVPFRYHPSVIVKACWRAHAVSLLFLMPRRSASDVADSTLTTPDSINDPPCARWRVGPLTARVWMSEMVVFKSVDSGAHHDWVSAPTFNELVKRIDGWRDVVFKWMDEMLVELELRKVVDISSGMVLEVWAELKWGGDLSGRPALKFRYGEDNTESDTPFKTAGNMTRDRNDSDSRQFTSELQRKFHGLYQTAPSSYVGCGGISESARGKENIEKIDKLEVIGHAKGWERWAYSHQTISLERCLLEHLAVSTDTLTARKHRIEPGRTIQGGRMMVGRKNKGSGRVIGVDGAASDYTGVLKVKS